MPPGVPPMTTRSYDLPFTSSGFAAFFGALGGGDGMPRICPSATSRGLSFAYSTDCTGTPSSIAIAAAVAAVWLDTMNTGSMRMLEKATWLADRANVTSRLSHSACLGTIER